MTNKVFIDIDGLLTNETKGWDYSKRTPNEEALGGLKQLEREGKFIVLYTSRGTVPYENGDMKSYDKDLKDTKEWLKKFGVPYHKLKLKKPSYDWQWDDKSSNQLRKKVLCFSTGVDSLVASYYLGSPELVYFDLGTKYTHNEINAIIKLAEIDSKFEEVSIDNSLKVGGTELSGIGETKTDIIPYRNLMLLSLASNYGSDLYLAGIAGDKSRDKNPDSFMIMENTLNFLKEEKNKQFSVSSPFWDKTKGEIIKWFLQNNNDAEELLKVSVSCFSEDKIDKGCGVCNACLRKYYGLVWAYNELNMKFDFEDYFINDPKDSNTFKWYIANLNNYSSKRYLEMKRVHDILNI